MANQASPKNDVVFTSSRGVGAGSSLGTTGSLSRWLDEQLRNPRQSRVLAPSTSFRPVSFVGWPLFNSFYLMACVTITCDNCPGPTSLPCSDNHQQPICIKFKLSGLHFEHRFSGINFFLPRNLLWAAVCCTICHQIPQPSKTQSGECLATNSIWNPNR